MDWPQFGSDRYLQKQPDGNVPVDNNNRSINNKGGDNNPPFAIQISTEKAVTSRAESVSSVPDVDFYSFSLERIKYIKNESTGHVQFVRHLLLYLRNTFFFIVFLVIMMFLPLSMIAVGAVYQDDCPRQTYIPVYLIVGGVLAFVRNAMEIATRVLLCCGYVIEEDEAVCTPWKRALRRAPGIVVDVFLLVWFLAGSVWVYTTVGSFTSTPGSPDYCSPKLYSFTFWVVTVVWMVGALLIPCAMFVCPWRRCLCRSRGEEEVKAVEQKF